MKILKFGDNIEVKIDLGADGREDIWLDTAKIATLYGKDRSVITKHIAKIYKDEEVDSNSYKTHIVITEKNGKKYKTEKKEYNLDVILSIGYKVNGKMGTKFRKWANEVLGKSIKSQNLFLSLGSIFHSMKLDNNIHGFIYVIESQGYYKIGKTISLENRIKTYVTENPNEIKLIHSFKCKNYSEVEKDLHQKFHKKRIRGEWFQLDEKDILKIKSLKLV